MINQRVDKVLDLTKSLEAAYGAQYLATEDDARRAMFCYGDDKYDRATYGEINLVGLHAMASCQIHRVALGAENLAYIVCKSHAL